MQCMQKGEGWTLRILLQENQGNKWKKSTQATSVSMIILSINVVVSTLFIKIRDGGETLTYNIWWSIAETITEYYDHRILWEFHRVALNILLHYPFWRLQYCIFSVIFIMAFLSWKELECWKKEQCQWCFIWHWCLPFFQKINLKKKKWWSKYCFWNRNCFWIPLSYLYFFSIFFFRKHNISWTTK